MGKVKGRPFTFSQKLAALYVVITSIVSCTYLLDAAALLRLKVYQRICISAAIA
jgi:hypothetical protein